MASRGRRKSVGVVEMAHDLGVSTATVSRALNGSPSVRRELADRIRAHAQERGYVANRLARALSASTSRAFVGFVIPYVDTPAYSAVAAECARLMSAAGTQMILAITENDAEREFQQLRDLVGTRIAGLVISPSTHVLGDTRQLLAGPPGGGTAPGVRHRRTQRVQRRRAGADRRHRAPGQPRAHRHRLPGHSQGTVERGNAPARHQARGRAGRPRSPPDHDAAGRADAGERQGRGPRAARRVRAHHRAGGRQRLAVGRRRRRGPPQRPPGPRRPVARGLRRPRLVRPRRPAADDGPGLVRRAGPLRRSPAAAGARRQGGRHPAARDRTAPGARHAARRGLHRSAAAGRDARLVTCSATSVPHRARSPQ